MRAEPDQVGGAGELDQGIGKFRGLQQRAEPERDRHPPCQATQTDTRRGQYRLPPPFQRGRPQHDGRVHTRRDGQQGRGCDKGKHQRQIDHRKRSCRLVAHLTGQMPRVAGLTCVVADRRVRSQFDVVARGTLHRIDRPADVQNTFGPSSGPLAQAPISHRRSPIPCRAQAGDHAAPGNTLACRQSAQGRTCFRTARHRQPRRAMSDRSGALIGPPTRQGARYRWQAKLRKQSESFSACATATNGASSPRC